MADNFGTDYTREVQDVNEGRISQGGTRTAIDKSRSAKSQQVTRPAPLESGNAQAIVKFASSTIAGINKRQQAEDYREAYNNASQETFDTLAKDESGIFNKIVGHSASFKGAQQKIVDTEIEKHYQSQLRTVSQDARNFATIEDYRASHDEKLEAALSNQTDSDTRNRIIEGATKNGSKLAGEYMRQRMVYEQVLENRAATDRLSAISDTLDVAQTTGNPDVVQAAQKDLQAALTRPEEIHPDAWEDIIANAVVADLGNNKTNLLGALEKSGKVTDFSAETQDKLRKAKSIWNTEYSQRFFSKALDLEFSLAMQDKNFQADLAQYKKEYPSVDTKRWMKAWNKRAQKVAKEAQKVQQNTQLLQSGLGKNITSKADRNKAWENVVTIEGKQAAQQKRLENLRDNPDTATPLTEAYTVEEQTAALKLNPNSFVSKWQANQTANTPMLSDSVMKVLTLSNAEELTADQTDELRAEIKFLNHFDRRSPTLLAKQLPTEAYVRYKHMDLLVNRSGLDFRAAVLEIRKGQQRTIDPEELDFEVIRNRAEDALRDFTVAEGFETFLGWDTDPDNQDALLFAAQDAYEDLLKLTNNADIAEKLTTNMLAHKSIRFGDNLLLNGTELDKASVNGSFSDYSDLADNSRLWKDRWEAAGFPRNRSIKDEANVITMHPNGRGISVRSQDVDGNSIYMDLLAPTNDKDMKVIMESQMPEPTPLVDSAFGLVSESFITTGNIINDLFTTPPTPESHLPPEAPAELAAPQQQPTQTPQSTTPAGNFQNVKDAIADVETSHGADSLKAYDQPPNKNGYEGKYQFRYRNKNDAGYDIAVALGIDPKTKKTPEQQEAIMDEFMRRNADRLTKKGIEPTPYHLWLAHNQGVGGASAILRGKLTKNIRRNIRNQGVSGTTDAELIANYHKKFKKRF